MATLESDNWHVVDFFFFGSENGASIQSFTQKKCVIFLPNLPNACLKFKAI